MLKPRTFNTIFLSKCINLTFEGAYMSKILISSISLALCLNGMLMAYPNQGSSSSQYNQNSNSDYQDDNGSSTSRYNPNSDYQNRNSSPSSQYNQNPNIQNRGAYQGSSPSKYAQNSDDQDRDSDYDQDNDSSSNKKSKDSYYTAQTNRNIQEDDSDVKTSENKYPQDSASTDVDRKINAKIRNKITGWFSDNYKNIAIKTSNGVVLITGNVKNPDDVNALVIEVRKIDGVRNVKADVQVNDQAKNKSSSSSDNSNVNNNSKYPQDRGATDADRQLNIKIRDKITGWFSDPYKNVSLNANNGDVTITGTVKTNDDLTKLSKEVRKVDGVRSVNNNVQVTDL